MHDSENLMLIMSDIAAKPLHVRLAVDPVTYTACLQLKYMSLSGNDLSGTLPSSWSSFNEVGKKTCVMCPGRLEPKPYTSATAMLHFMCSACHLSCAC